MSVLVKSLCFRLGRSWSLQRSVTCRYSSKQSEMCEFYSGKNIFITGATGFVGKVLLEKVLSALPGVGSVYVLVRGKKNVQFNDRLKQLLNEPIFTKYKRVDANNMSKVVGIEGQFGDKGLQISEKDRRTLTERVNIVFHIASTVRFDEPLHDAMNAIFVATKSMLSLANDVRQLSSFVYVSTAFSNMQQYTADEMVYDMKIDGDGVLALYEKYGKEDVEKLAKRNYIDGRPNTYCFAKALTENYIKRHCSHLPVAITRPSIICAALSEPTAGYCDSPSALSFGMIYQALGICRFLPYRDSAYVDLIPVDIVTNSMLIVARDVSLQATPVTSVYNVSARTHWPLTQKQTADSNFKAIMRAPLTTARRPLPHRVREKTILEQYLLMYFSELPFAIWTVTKAKLFGKKSRMLKLTRFIQSTRDDQTKFYRNSYLFPRKNMDAAVARLTEDDKKRFQALPIVRDNDEYFYHYWMSLRELVLKQDTDSIDAAHIHQKKLRRRSQTIQWALAANCFMVSGLYIFV